MSEFKKRMKTSIIDENPTFVSFLALCPTLGTTTSLKTAFGMGVTVLITLMITNMATSAARKIITPDIRIPVFITLIATIVTLMEIIIETYIPALYSSLGILLPLVVVNCIILGRAEAYCVDHNILDSLIDGIGAGLAFTISLSTLGLFREILGTGAVGIFSYNLQIFPSEIMPGLFVEGTGAFLAFGFLAWIINEIKGNIEQKKKDKLKKESKPSVNSTLKEA
jgi:Na+-translocating ferredoxin:NAD+ oxidoreductase subunit E